MHNHYADILSRIDQPPLWFDEHAVPRFDKFAPSMIADIYAEECCLALILCQGCQAPYHVAFSVDTMDQYQYAFTYFAHHKIEPEPGQLGEKMKEATLEAMIRGRSLHYGDPPNMPCCAAGASMNSEPQKVLEFWRRGTPETFLKWERVPELEVSIIADWARR